MSFNSFLDKPLNVSEEKCGRGVIKSIVKNKKGEISYVVRIDLDNGGTIEAKSDEYAVTSPMLEIGTDVQVTYCKVKRGLRCTIQDDTLITADDARDQNFIYIACVVIMTAVLFAIFMGAKLIF